MDVYSNRYLRLLVDIYSGSLKTSVHSNVDGDVAAGAPCGESLSLFRTGIVCVLFSIRPGSLGLSTAAAFNIALRSRPDRAGLRLSDSAQ
jgi:hypothetical protein